MILAIVGLFYIHSTWIPLVFVCWFIYAPLNVGVTLHRLLAHKSFKTHQWLSRALSVLSATSTMGPTINWVAVHRMHHVYADTNGDPHTPYVNSNFNLLAVIKVWFGCWTVKNVPPNYIKDLMRDPIHRWIFNNYFTIIIGWIIILAVINPWLVIYAYALPCTLALYSTSAVNVLGHVHGYRTYNTKDHSTNSWLANILSFGEGWHNTHHANPSRSYLKDHWWEWDIIGLLIAVISIRKPS